MFTQRSTIYLIYAVLVLFTFLGDKLLKKTDKRSRTLGYLVCIIGDLGILANGLWTYLKYKDTNIEIASQTGFVLGGIIFGVCVLCLLGRYWQNKELDKRRKHDQEEES